MPRNTSWPRLAGRETHFSLLAVVLAGMTWGTSGLFVRALDRWGWGALDIAAARVTGSLVLLAMGIVVLWPRAFRIDRPDLKWFLLAGFAGPGTAQPLFVLGLLGAPVAVAVLLNYTAPFFVAILGRFLLKETITPRKVTALALSLTGLCLVTAVLPRADFGSASIQPAALLAGLGSGFFYAIQLLAVRRLSTNYHPATVQLWGPALGLPFLLAFRHLLSGRAALAVAGAGSEQPLLSVASLGTCLAMCLGPGLLAFLLMTYGLARIQASHASIVLTVEPVVAAILGYAVLGETLTATQVLGMGLVLAAIVVVRR